MHTLTPPAFAPTTAVSQRFHLSLLPHPRPPFLTRVPVANALCSAPSVIHLPFAPAASQLFLLLHPLQVCVYAAQLLRAADSPLALRSN